MIEQKIDDLTKAIGQLTAAILASNAARAASAPAAGKADIKAAGPAAGTEAAGKAAIKAAGPAAAEIAGKAAGQKKPSQAEKTKTQAENGAAQPQRAETEQAATQAKPAETEQGAKQIDMEKVRELTRKVSQADDDAKQALRKMVIASGVKKLGDMPPAALAQFVARLVELAGRLGIQSEL